MKKLRSSQHFHPHPNLQPMQTHCRLADSHLDFLCWIWMLTVAPCMYLHTKLTIWQSVPHVVHRENSAFSTRSQLSLIELKDNTLQVFSKTPELGGSGNYESQGPGLAWTHLAGQISRRTWLYTCFNEILSSVLVIVSTGGASGIVLFSKYKIQLLNVAKSLYISYFIPPYFSS